MMDLKDVIISRIRAEGPISFRDFMNMALYYPHHGYYCYTKEVYTKDYLTSPIITSLFGKLIATQLEEIWKWMGGKKITIVEYGAGSGILCSDILQQLSKNRKLYEHLVYYIMEKNTSHAGSIQASFPGKVKYIQQTEEVPQENTCVLSNELVDNFPVHIIFKQEEYREVFVGYHDDFLEVLQPVNPELMKQIEGEYPLKEGEKGAVNLESKRWIQTIGNRLHSGVVITIDYGYTTDGGMTMNRHEDAIHPVTCYYRHHRHFNPYIHIGEQDITADVNFSALRHWGEEAGLHFAALVPQQLFLSALGFTEALRKTEDHKALPPGFMASFFLNEFVLQMGRNIKIMLQYKGLSRPRLKGFSLL